MVQTRRGQQRLRLSIQPLGDVAHLLPAGALEQPIVEIGLVLVWHNTHKAHQRTAARAMWWTDRERLGLGIWGWHMFLPSPGDCLRENYGAKWPRIPRQKILAGLKVSEMVKVKSCGS